MGAVNRVWGALENPHKQGFTLIEMSVVLVIIGLIVGGVLAGRSLIEQACERAQITQIERYRTATNTFYGKYNALPGDLTKADASLFGFFTRTGAHITAMETASWNPILIMDSTAYTVPVNRRFSGTTSPWPS